MRIRRRSSERPHASKWSVLLGYDTETCDVAKSHYTRLQAIAVENVVQRVVKKQSMVICKITLPTSNCSERRESRNRHPLQDQHTPAAALWLPLRFRTISSVQSLCTRLYQAANQLVSAQVSEVLTFCLNSKVMFLASGAHSSLILRSNSSKSAVGGIRISKPASASEGWRFITKPVGDGVPAFRKDRLMDVTCRIQGKLRERRIQGRRTQTSPADWEHRRLQILTRARGAGSCIDVAIPVRICPM
jgi:hypothetical protein